jgi:L-alanine-DL-glutamate epimerase-like enolase superfamily enzyme
VSGKLTPDGAALTSGLVGSARIEDVACHACSVPLPTPLQVGQMTVTHRTYDLVRIRTSDGLEGVSYAFSRGLPVARIVEDALAPLLIDADPALPEVIRARLGNAYWPYAERGLFSVAASAVDLALWDLLGKRLGTPLADLLGRCRNDVPICAVGGYARAGLDDIAALQQEMATFVDLGCRAFKITVGAAEPARDAERVAAVREVVGADSTLVVDAFRSFRSMEDALRRLRLLEPFDLSYVEDPFTESLAPLVADLRRRTGMLIGLGENLAGHRAFRELIESRAVDVVRCDATVVGGVRELMATVALASARGLEVSTHVHPDIHVHFGAALSNLHPAGLEYVHPDSGLDAFHKLLGTQLEVRDGCAVVPARPGLGLDVDWEAVGRYTRA